MPTLHELRSRCKSDFMDTVKHAAAEESLVADARGLLRPAQMVEEKLRTVLQVRGHQTMPSVSGRTSARHG